MYRRNEARQAGAADSCQLHGAVVERFIPHSILSPSKTTI